MASTIDDVHDAQSAWYKRARFQLRVDARSETELGTLRAYLAFNAQYTTSNVGEVTDLSDQFFVQDIILTDNLVSTASFDSTIEHAYLELGGFRAGKTDSLFSTFTGYAGGVIHDDLIPYGPFDTFQLAYTWTGGNGFTAAVALEDPAGGDDQFYGTAFYTSDDYVPNVVAGLGWTGGWGGVSAVAGYDAVWEQFAVKARVDFKVAEYLSLFLMGGWADKDDIVDPATGYLLHSTALCRSRTGTAAGVATGPSGVVAPGRSRRRLRSTCSSPMTISRTSRLSRTWLTSSFPASRSRLKSPMPTASGTPANLATSAPLIVSRTMMVAST